MAESQLTAISRLTARTDFKIDMMTLLPFPENSVFPHNAGPCSLVTLAQGHWQEIKDGLTARAAGDRRLRLGVKFRFPSPSRGRMDGQAT